VLVSVVMSLPTTGPMLLAALQSQDMYLAGSFLMFLALLTVIGMFVSDLLLAWLDPRIRLQGGVSQ
ncbi:MAG TPA: ABC transporter permease, partial [Thalassospira sp.]|nr:ABC transporter permease [Thalassospira sp.]